MVFQKSLTQKHSVKNTNRHGLIGNLLPSGQRRLFDPYSNFAHSLEARFITPKSLQEIAETTIFSRAIEIISNGVAGMRWQIEPPKGKEKDPEAIATAEQIAEALQTPNRSDWDTYRSIMKVLVKDLLIFGICAVERQPAEYDNSQPFWLWPVSVQDIEIDPDWDASFEGIQPRYWFAPKNHNGRYILHQDEWVPIYSRNMFTVQCRAATYQKVSPSPVRLAYDDMCAWLKLHGYQNHVVSNPVRDYLISVEGASDDQLQAFREYWSTMVVGSGIPPIVAGKASVIKFNARNDEELFLKYSDFLMGLIALEFGLSKRDFGIDPNDNRSTFEPAAELSFQQGVLPIAETMVETLDLKVVKFYFPGYRMKLSDTEPRNEDKEAATAKTLYEGGIIKKNEARSRVGEEPVPDGDQFAPQNQAANQPNPPVE